MKIKRMYIKNFRSILEETLECDDLTVLIGRNGAGKSTFLQALRVFMDTSANVSKEDFYNRDDTKKIDIEVTFSDLNKEERAEFASYLTGDHLSVSRRFPGGDYFGKQWGCEDFADIRQRLAKKEAVKNVAETLAEMVQSGNFPGLNSVSRNIDAELDRWEKENPERCSHHFRAGIFHGPTNIAGGKLRNKTHFVYVAPVREAELDASASSRQSPLNALVAPLANAIAEKNEKVKAAADTIEKTYSEFKQAVEQAPEKTTLESALSTLLKRYDSKAEAQLQFKLDEKLKLPSASPLVWLSEDGFVGEVSQKGHGLQRLFIFTILELYEKYRWGYDDYQVENKPEGSIVLAIEEPELYQHPSRSRALAKILKDLSCQSGDSKFKFQVFFTTHSPYFVSIDNFQAVRRVEKTEGSDPDSPMITKIKSTTLKEVGKSALEVLEKNEEAKKVSELSSWARLRSIIGIHGSEGLFSDGVILVEGDEDQAIIEALAEKNDSSLDSSGISVIPAGGKTKVLPLLLLYRQLGIKCYMIFDADGNKASDRDAQTEYNEALLKAISEAPYKRPLTRIYDQGAVWRINFVKEIKSELEEGLWEKAFARACDEYAISFKQAAKKYAVIRRTAEIILQEQNVPKCLENLWDAIIKHFGIS